MCIHPVLAQVSADHPNKLWKAQWVTAPGVPQRDEVVLHFRKVIDVSELQPHFYVDVSADNQFIFQVNQRRVGSLMGDNQKSRPERMLDAGQ